MMANAIGSLHYRRGAASLVFDLFKILKGLFLCNYSYTIRGVLLKRSYANGVKLQSTKAGYPDRYFSLV